MGNTLKFSIVTPSFNSAKFFNETIQSVISQKGEFSIEYIIVDNCSKDGTIDLITQYEEMINKKLYRFNCNEVEIKYIQQKDRGMYDAINTGFANATGDIFAWINSDDIYLPGAFNIIARSFIKYPEIKWIKGITSYIDESSVISKIGKCFLYDQKWIQNGFYGKEAYFIQQDSVFWRSDLWKTVGGIDARFKRAGDYYLWTMFAKYTPLYSLKAYVSCFRKVTGQLSMDLKSYMNEYEMVDVMNRSWFLQKKVKLYFTSFFSFNNKIFLRIFEKPLYKILFGRQKLPLIDVSNGELSLRKVSHYVVC